MNGIVAVLCAVVSIAVIAIYAESGMAGMLLSLLPLLYLIPHLRTFRDIRLSPFGSVLNRYLGKTSRNLLILTMLQSCSLLLLHVIF